MILREMNSPEPRWSSHEPPRPAWDVFAETQKLLAPPYAIIFQPEHSALAGDLAECLAPNLFGEIPPEVIAAIRHHDAGWEANDESQTAALATAEPKPFLLVSPGQAIPCWTKSIRIAEAASVLRGVLTSRHFCALAPDDAAHHEFLAEENERRQHTEKSLAVPVQDLDRWTAALGFCDLLSLYLCSGTIEPCVFPLAHPALPQAKDAEKVVLSWREESPQFAQPVLRSGAEVSVTVQERLTGRAQLEERKLAWSFR